MFSFEAPILQRLAVLVVCHGLAVGEIISHYSLVQRQMSWSKAREFCQRHYVDLAVPNTEEQYLTLFNASAAKQFSFWLGLRRQSISGHWMWVNGEELTYDQWYRRNYDGYCASLEAILKKDKKLIARYCDELHMFFCQGPVSPQAVMVDSVGTDHVNLSWNVSAFMQMTPHTYNVTICTNTCSTLLYLYIDGYTFMNMSISNLTPATMYFIKIAAFVVRRDDVTGEDIVLQSQPADLQVQTGSHERSKVIVILKLIKLVFLAPVMWVLYHILKKGNSKLDQDVSPVVPSAEDTVVDLIPRKTRSAG